MQLLSTLQTLKLVTITVVLMREPTLTVATPLAGVSRSHVIHVEHDRLQNERHHVL